MTIAAYFKRNANSIDGQFTIQKVENGIVKPIFKRIHVRSGQAGFTKTHWVRKKSPIPAGLEYWIHLQPVGEGTHAGATGIGEFWPISNSRTNVQHIIEPGPKPVGVPINERWDIGLHEENKWDGSAGCIVIVKENEAHEIFEYLDQLRKTEKLLPLKVFF